jgi:hypothetical protein
VNPGDVVKAAISTGSCIRVMRNARIMPLLDLWERQRLIIVSSICKTDSTDGVESWNCDIAMKTDVLEVVKSMLSIIKTISHHADKADLPESRFETSWRIDSSAWVLQYQYVQYNSTWLSTVVAEAYFLSSESKIAWLSQSLCLRLSQSNDSTRPSEQHGQIATVRLSMYDVRKSLRQSALTVPLDGMRLSKERAVSSCGVRAPMAGATGTVKYATMFRLWPSYGPSLSASL